MTTHDPRALLLTQLEAAQRLTWSEKTVARARQATDPEGSPKPMAGWKNIGTTRKPKYVIAESDLIAYIEQLEAA